MLSIPEIWRKRSEAHTLQICLLLLPRQEWDGYYRVRGIVNTKREWSMDRTRAAHREPVSTQAHLPAQLTATIGRADEIAALVSMLKQEEARLITLTGPGGVGKTRLGLEVARAVQDVFADGVFFVSLAPLREQGQALLAIAQAIGIDEAGGHELERRLREYLQEKHCLILLDNCQIPRSEDAGLVSKLHRNSAYLKRRAALISLLDTSGVIDKNPVLIQSCRMSNVRITMFLAPTRSACRV